KKEKGELYQNADVFVLPSLYEGFGLPVLEAMNYGVPVVCSSSSSLPEVAGDTTLLVNPNNPEEIAEAINKVFSNNDLKEKIIKKGFENVKKFSWEKCVKETMDMLLYC
ncbi:glycosyltransferase, partial [Candidatus Parcubacteria bacterium]|nr:glycosyltransferase [Candidatus Parcubacteria bacterium]